MVLLVDHVARRREHVNRGRQCGGAYHTWLSLEAACDQMLSRNILYDSSGDTREGSGIVESDSRLGVVARKLYIVTEHGKGRVSS